MALVYRAHFAFMVRPIVNSRGMNVSAVFGFANTLIELIKNEQPTHLAVVFDTAAPTARHVEFPAYKAQREAMPEDLSQALPHVKKLIEALNIPVLVMDGYEADDIIGTLARQAETHQGYVTYMVTPDKDFAQLVDERTFIYKPGRQGSEHEIIDVNKVREQWLVARPEQVIDVLALWGDVSDNIPGVPGIGEKTAKALIQKFGTVENIFEKLDELKGKQKENIEANREQLKLCKRLATIDCAVPIGVDVDALKVRPYNVEAVKEILMEMEFNQLGRRLLGDSFQAGRGYVAANQQAEVTPAVPDQLKGLADTPHEYRVMETGEWDMAGAQQVAVALDVDGGDAKSARLRGVALSWQAHQAVYLPCEGAIPAALASLLKDASVVKVAYDVKFMLTSLLWHDIEVAGAWQDLLLAQIIADPDQKFSLKFLSEAHLGYSPGISQGAAGNGELDLETDTEAEARRVRTMETADLCGQLQPHLLAMIDKTHQHRVFQDIEMPLVPVLARMERWGIRVDIHALKELGDILQQQIAQLETSIHTLAGQSFNINSPRQLGQILFENLRLLEKPKKTKTGQYMTNEEVLQELLPLHPIVAQLLEYREATKLKSTYVDALPHSVSPRTGRVHTNYHQLSTATGRLASNHPNLQNIPIRSEQGREIRRAFVAEGEGWELLSADYSQIELRVMAHLSGDEAMQEAFHSGLDVHTATAAKVFEVMPGLVTPEMRRTAKMVNFGIIYGISAFGLAQRLNLPRGECQRLIDGYFVQYPKIKAFMQHTIEQAAAGGFVETMTGRRRYLRDLRSANATVRKAAERTAINTPIQGTAADMIKLAMIRISAALAAGNFQARMLLQVHDELVFEVPTGELKAVEALVRDAMVQALPLSVPLQVDFGHGMNWKSAHP